MTEDEHYRAYQDGSKAFAAAGIKWNEKGSPHRLLLNARKHLKFVAFTKIVSLTFRAHRDQIVENLSASNALSKRLSKMEYRA